MTRAILALFVGLVACGDPPPPREIVVVEVRGAGLDLEQLTWEPQDAVVRVVRSPDRVELAMAAQAVRPSSLRIVHPQACPEDAVTPTLAQPRAVVQLRPWLGVSPELPQVGFSRPFAIEARPGCREALRGTITWRRVSGAELDGWAVEQNGWRLRATTKSFDALTPARQVPLGIVPFSASTRGETIVEATWSRAGATLAQRVRVAAAARASGLPSIAYGHEVWLAGAGWHVTQRPANGHANVRMTAPRANPTSPELVSFLPDVAGRWEVSDSAGTTLQLRIGRHDETPLDCGRRECHQSAAELGVVTPMARALSRNLASCTLPCHAVGEPGLPDGGFTDVLAGLGRTHASIDGARWDELPSALRRVGGVGCTACHGPGAIPERTSRWAILRSDVCAVCHDGPPRYGHVAAWRTTRMARSDAAPETRAPECASCHTTVGFLASIGARATAPEHMPPDGAAPIGVTCSACHAPHAVRLDRALIRRVPTPSGMVVPPAWGTGSTSVCLRCHEQGAAAVVLARGGPHAAVEGGCLGCHRAGPEDLEVERGASHGFRADPASCRASGCHGSAPPRTLDLAARARAITARAAGAQLDVTRPPHAQPGAFTLVSPTATFGGLVTIANDRAAHVHGGAAARALVEAAEREVRPQP